MTKSLQLMSIFFIKSQGSKWSGPSTKGPQNLMSAHKMLRPRAQMALENVSSFQNLMYKRYYKKNKSCPEKKLRVLILLIPGAQIALWILDYFDPS